MVRTEQYILDEREVTRTYSDAGRYVVRDGASYEEACDPAESGRTYTEGDVIPVLEPSEEEYAQVGRIMMGVENDNNREGEGSEEDY